MVFTGGGSFGGQVTVSGTMTLEGGTFSVADGTTIAAPTGGSGSLLLNAGSLTLGGSLTTTILTVVGGTLNGTGNLAAGSQVDWTGGDVSGSLTNAGTLTVAGTGNKFLYGPLTNAGTIAVTGSGTIYAEAGSADLTNQAGATFDFQAPADLDNNGFSLTFTNAGTLERSTGTGTADIGDTLDDIGGTVQALSGTLDLPNSGLVSSGTLSVGTWVVGSNGTLTISGVSSITTLSTDVTLQGSGATFTGLSQLGTIGSAGKFQLQDGLLHHRRQSRQCRNHQPGARYAECCGHLYPGKHWHLRRRHRRHNARKLIWPTERDPECVA